MSLNALDLNTALIVFGLPTVHAIAEVVGRRRALAETFGARGLGGERLR